MARINLLPWREERRKQRQREFISIAAGSVVLMLLVILYVHLHISGMIDNQESRNQYLQKNIKQVEAKIKEIKELEKQKQQLIARMKVIERLQGNRPEVVHLFDEIVKAVPDGLYLASLQQKQSQLVLKGRAQSNARVSAFMRNLDASAWFKQPVLDVIEVNKGKEESTRSFTLHVKQASEKARNKRTASK